MPAPEAAATAESGSRAPPPLDETMLAMDVVDTLRHADKLVERELSSDERDRQLKERLRQIYAGQGIVVPDHVLDEGVAALREDRFVYTPSKPSFDRSLALFWVRRHRWFRGALIIVALALLAAGAYEFAVRRPEVQRQARIEHELGHGLPRAIQRELANIRSIARDERAALRARELASLGLAAAKAGEIDKARARAAELQALREELARTYTIRVVSRPGEPSGIIRTPDINPRARNYYLIVEAVDADGRPIPVRVTSEEEGKTERVRTWGIRVDERTFNRIRNDKQDDGIIQNDRVGIKEFGKLDVDWSVPREGGAVLRW